MQESKLRQPLPVPSKDNNIQTQYENIVFKARDCSIISYHI